MEPLTYIPWTFTGRIANCNLITFSVEPEELRPMLPEPFKPHLYEGRALLSIADLDLRGLRLRTRFPLPHFTYRHIGLRVLLEDPFGQGEDGLFYLRSWTQRPMLRRLANLGTEFRYADAQFRYLPGGMVMKTEEHFLHYNYCGPADQSPREVQLHDLIERTDISWSLLKGKIWKRRIRREAWPQHAMNCNVFATNLFFTARLETATKVQGIVPFEWPRPQPAEAMIKELRPTKSENFSRTAILSG